jgi:hypothetical protein
MFQCVGVQQHLSFSAGCCTQGRNHARPALYHCAGPKQQEYVLNEWPDFLDNPWGKDKLPLSVITSHVMWFLSQNASKSCSHWGLKK